MNGWVLSNPDDGFLNFTEVGASPGHTGRPMGPERSRMGRHRRLRPAAGRAAGARAVATCSPAGTARSTACICCWATARSRSTTRRRAGELASYARSGMTVKDAWFRAAKEIQPSTNGAVGAGRPDRLGRRDVGRQERRRPDQRPRVVARLGVGRPDVADVPGLHVDSLLTDFGPHQSEEDVHVGADQPGPVLGTVDRLPFVASPTTGSVAVHGELSGRAITATSDVDPVERAPSGAHEAVTTPSLTYAAGPARRARRPRRAPQVRGRVAAPKTSRSSFKRRLEGTRYRRRRDRKQPLRIRPVPGEISAPGIAGPSVGGSAGGVDDDGGGGVLAADKAKLPNGSYRKTVTTEIGPSGRAAGADHNASLDSVTVPNG